MEISLLEQVSIFFAAVSFGCVLSVLYDIFSAVTIIFNFNKRQFFIKDILYFVLIAVLTFLFLLVSNDGDFRVYILVGEILGFSVYHFTIGKACLRLFLKILKVVCKISNKIKTQTTKQFSSQKKRAILCYLKVRKFLKAKKQVNQIQRTAQRLQKQQNKAKVKAEKVKKQQSQIQKKVKKSRKSKNKSAKKQ